MEPKEAFLFCSFYKDRFLEHVGKLMEMNKEMGVAVSWDGVALVLCNEKENWDCSYSYQEPHRWNGGEMRIFLGLFSRRKVEVRLSCVVCFGNGYE